MHRRYGNTLWLHVSKRATVVWDLLCSSVKPVYLCLLASLLVVIMGGRECWFHIEQNKFGIFDWRKVEKEASTLCPIPIWRFASVRFFFLPSLCLCLISSKEGMHDCMFIFALFLSPEFNSRLFAMDLEVDDHKQSHPIKVSAFFHS